MMSDEKKDGMPVRENPQGERQDSDVLEQAPRRGGLFGRFNQRFNEALQSGRAPERRQESAVEIASQPVGAGESRRVRNIVSSKMVIPDGIVVEGSVKGGGEGEIGGRIEGNVIVGGRLYVGSSAVIGGEVRSGSCIIEGLVEGKVDATEEVEVGKTGRLNADVTAGKRIVIAGQVYGNVTTNGVLRLASASVINGDVRARRLMVEEGAFFNGRCSMRPPAQQQPPAPPKPPPTPAIKEK